MKRIILAIIACMVIISCSDNPIETGTKDFRISVTMLRNKLTSGTAGTVAFRVESNKKTVTVEDFSIIHVQTGEPADWINFINFPYGADYTDSHDIQLNDNGYAEFWTEPIEVGTHSGAYEVRVRFYDASTKSYSDTFTLEFVAVGEERAESASIDVQCGFNSKMNTPYVLSYDLGQPETTMTVRVLKSINNQTFYSGNVGLIHNNNSTKVYYINDENLYDRQNIIDSNKSDYSLFIWKESTYSENSTVFRISPGACYVPGSFDIYDKDDPSNRVTVTTYLRYPVVLCLDARVGNNYSERCEPKGSLPYKLRTYGWFGTFTTEITASIVGLFLVGDDKYVTSIPDHSNSWSRKNSIADLSTYHLGCEYSDNYDNGFHAYDYTKIELNSPDDLFAVTLSLDMQGNDPGSVFYKGNRSASSAQHYNTLKDNSIKIPKDNRRDFPVIVAPGHPEEVKDLAYAMNYCCDLVTVANNYNTGHFSATAYSKNNGHWSGNRFGLKVSSVEYNKDRYKLNYLLEWYRGLANEKFDEYEYGGSKGTGHYGYNYNGGRTVWYEGCGVSPVQSLSHLN